MMKKLEFTYNEREQIRVSILTRIEYLKKQIKYWEKRTKKGDDELSKDCLQTVVEVFKKELEECEVIFQKVTKEE